MDEDHFRPGRSVLPEKELRPIPLPAGGGFPVLRVLVGAALGMIAGGILSTLPEYRGATISMSSSSPTGMASQTVDYTPLVRSLAWVIGTAAGGIIGSIAGLASQSGKSVAFLWIGCILAIVAAVFVAGMFFWFLKPSGPAPAPAPAQQQPADPAPDPK